MNFNLDQDTHTSDDDDVRRKASNQLGSLGLLPRLAGGCGERRPIFNLSRQTLETSDMHALHARQTGKIHCDLVYGTRDRGTVFAR